MLKGLSAMMQKWARQLAYWILGNTASPSERRQSYTVLQKRTTDFYTYSTWEKDKGDNQAYLMNLSERKLYDLLLETLQLIDEPDTYQVRKFYLFTQVPLNQIIKPNHISDRDYLFYETGLLRVDFVLCNYLMMPVCIIESDGAYHTKRKNLDDIRDTFCKNHRVGILRLPSDYGFVEGEERNRRRKELFMLLRNSLFSRNKYNMYNRELCQKEREGI